MKSGIIFVGLLLLSFFSADIQAGKIYKWKDKNGKIHFSDKPPKDESIKTESKTVEEVNTIVGKPSTARKPDSSSESKGNGGLTLAQCKKSVANAKRGIPKFRRALIKQAGNNAMAVSIVDDMTKDIEKEATVEDCMTSQGKDLDGYRCLVNSSDIMRCMKGKP